MKNFPNALCCLNEELNNTVDMFGKHERMPKEKRSPLHFEYIEELKEKILELNRAKTLLLFFSEEEILQCIKDIIMHPLLEVKNKE